jgi:hypothetical protein
MSDRSEEAARYRRAAEHALDQLDWCIDYLYRLRKHEIARALARNEKSIRRRLAEAERSR